MTFTTRACGIVLLSVLGGYACSDSTTTTPPPPDGGSTTADSGSSTDSAIVQADSGRDSSVTAIDSAREASATADASRDSIATTTDTSVAADRVVISTDAIVATDTARPAVDSATDSSSGPGTRNPAGAALRLDGDDDYVLVSSTAGANESAFTAEAWFKTTAVQGVLFEVYSASPLGADRILYILEGKACFYVFSGNSFVCSEATFNDGEWHHVAGTLGSVGGQRVYVDGVLAGSIPGVVVSAFNWENAFRIGFGFLGSGGPQIGFGGIVDDVRVWSVERTAEQITNSRNAPVAIPSEGLINNWRFDEGLGTSISNAVADAPAGTLTNFAGITSPWVMPGAN